MAQRALRLLCALLLAGRCYARHGILAGALGASPEPNVVHAAVGHGAHGLWHTDWLLVVTWYNSSIYWLDQLPFQHHLKIALYIKQDSQVANRCSAVPALAKQHLALCREVPNANGREAHTIAMFVAEFYHSLPRIVVFSQDDCLMADPDGSLYPDFQRKADRCRIMRLHNMSAHALSDFAAHVEAAPFELDTCLCEVVLERNFFRCPADDAPRPPIMPAGRCYGPQWEQITDFWAVAGLDRLPQHQSLRWAAGANFAVPGAALHSLPLPVFRVAERILDGTGEKLGVDGMEVNATMRLKSAGVDVSRGGRLWPSFTWAHAFERMWCVP